ncbi:hypothetical protein GCK72_026093 [Caenorhabditis remanei]|uniref:Uncharacterized protein n=1 Tax=Caenorhabditis remanei TaxID=31234 RepID=A0A6A5G4J0_CAERE|nr:hypothetical protein GCK72_026093 [Caenorhabditis remanei]KAF1749625.1 hypothetical protein GCK72_026093 [Caenorhabditis remanei]
MLNRFVIVADYLLVTATSSSRNVSTSRIAHEVYLGKGDEELSIFLYERKSLVLYIHDVARDRLKQQIAIAHRNPPFLVFKNSRTIQAVLGIFGKMAALCRNRCKNDGKKNFELEAARNYWDVPTTPDDSGWGHR